MIGEPFTAAASLGLCCRTMGYSRNKEVNWMKSYTIHYVQGHEPGNYITTIKANSEDEAINKFYANNPKCAIVYK